MRQTDIVSINAIVYRFAYTEGVAAVKLELKRHM
jgi:hypothetical protein